VKLGKRSRLREAIQEDHSNYDLSDDASPKLTATHIGAISEPPLSIAMEEIPMHSVIQFTSLVEYLDDALPSISTSLSRFVPHSMWEDLHIDSKGKLIPKASL
jgi:hypothetical protein